MGIQGLLPFLKKIHKPVNVSKFSGCTVAIDAYCWLHKGAFSCAEKLALGEKTDQYVIYCMKFVNMLLQKNLKPILVFDGCHLPSKKNVEKSRREKRDLNRKKAAQFLREGKRAEARECFQRCIDISPEMALELMNTCRDNGVDCIVAPYEADSQLAYLNKIGVAQLIITEDSDLLLFGCEKVLFKMDHAGNGVLIEQENLKEVMDIQSGHYTFEKFRYMCILSGCDYLASLPGIGLGRANKVFKIARQSDIRQLLKKLSTYLKSNVTASQEYIDGFVAADNTFLYPLVYNPLQRKLVPLNPYPQDLGPDDMKYAGAYMSEKKALDLALGNINIYTGNIFADYDPDIFVPKHLKRKPEARHQLSMWNRNYRIRPNTALQESLTNERPNMKGKEMAVKVQLRRSPRKRVREVEDDKLVKTDNELSGLYGEVTPTKKRKRLENIGDEDLQRFLSIPSEDRQTESEEENILDTEPVKSGPFKSPLFYNSLSSAHPEVSPYKQEPDDDVKIDEKENSTALMSPTKNKFVCRSPSKKPRFDLNARKEVKSRFFSSASTSKQDDKKQLASGNTDKKNGGLAGYSFVHNKLDCDSKVQSKKTSPFSFSKSKKKSPYSRSITDWTSNKDSDSTSVDREPVNGNENRSKYAFSNDNDDSSVSACSQNQCEISTPKSQRTHLLGTPKSGSAFSWNKFEFGRKQSGGSGSASRAATGQFKRVVSENNLQTFLTSKSVKDENDDSEVNVKLEQKTSDISVDVTDKETCNTDDVKSGCKDVQCGSMFNNMDSPNMRDPDGSDSIQNSPSLNSQSSRDSSNRDSQSQGGMGKAHVVSDVIDLLESDDEDTCLQDRTRNTSTPALPSLPFKSTESGKHQKSTGLKPGCRVSGLSRKTKKSAKVENKSSDKQHSLKDMFAKFSHKQSDNKL